MPLPVRVAVRVMDRVMVRVVGLGFPALLLRRSC